jgi:DNA-binding transcriptional MerR regulator
MTRTSVGEFLIFYHYTEKRMLFFFRREVTFVEPNDEREKIKRLVLRVRETETPGRQGAAFCYAKAAYAAFREITALRDEGFSMAAIHKVMEIDGLLPENSSPHSFRRAFRRELARRDRAATATRNEHQDSDTGKQEAASGSAKPSEGAEAERERIRRQASATAKTGSGAIVKRADGGFDF